MSTELIINSTPKEVKIAVLEDGKLVELQNQQTQNEYAVGDIYLGKVKKIMDGLNSSFVDIGHEKESFLHYNDLGSHIKSFQKLVKQAISKTKKTPYLDRFKLEPTINKSGKIAEVLKGGDLVMVQITKESISTKGPRVTTEISIPGRYLVLVPINDKIFISQKIKKGSERERLKKTLEGILPKGFGFIARTNAENASLEDLKSDLDNLLRKWEILFAKLRENVVRSRLLSEMDRTAGILRDAFNSSYTSIIVDDANLYKDIRIELQKIAPEKEKIVKLYKDKAPVFEKFGIERQIKTSFGRNVPMAKGAYLVIEHTEAMHVIDVNSGNRTWKKNDQEANCMDVNLISAKEIARQVRLRDMGGIIVIDFIDMHKAENKKILYEKMEEFMKDDKAKHKILPLSKFGLMQITRQRVRPATDIRTAELSPDGTGEDIVAPINILNAMEQAIEQIERSNLRGKIYIHCHPFVAAYLTKGFPSVRLKWQFKFLRRISVAPRDAFQYLHYRFYDKDGKMVKI